MTPPTLHAGRNPPHIDGPASHPRRMAIKTIPGVLHGQRPPNSLFETPWLGSRRAHRQIQSVGLFVETHAALIPLAIALKQIGLPRRPQPKRPLERRTELLPPVRDPVYAPPAITLNPVAIRTNPQPHRGPRSQYLTLVGSLKSPSHPRAAVPRMLPRMAPGTLLVAGAAHTIGPQTAQRTDQHCPKEAHVSPPILSHSRQSVRPAKPSLTLAATPPAEPLFLAEWQQVIELLDHHDVKVEPLPLPWKRSSIPSAS